MGADLQRLIDNPMLLVAILFVGAMIGIGIEKFDRFQRRQKWQKRQGRSGKVVPFERQPPPKIPDAADQLRTVMRADFKAQPLLNKSEARLFKALDKMVIEMRPGWQITLLCRDQIRLIF